MKRILLILLYLGIIFNLYAPPPDHSPGGGTTPAYMNKDNVGYLGIVGDGAGRMNLRSASNNNFATISGPNKATVNYNIILMDTPTNGFWYGKISNNTLVLSAVNGRTVNIQILSPNNVTNTLKFNNGLLIP